MSSSMSHEGRRDEFGRNERSGQRNDAHDARDGDESYYKEKLLLSRRQQESNGRHHHRHREDGGDDFHDNGGSYTDRQRRRDGADDLHDGRKKKRSPSQDHHYASDYSDDDGDDDDDEDSRGNRRRRRSRSVSRDKERHSRNHDNRREPPPFHRDGYDDRRRRRYDDRDARKERHDRHDDRNGNDRRTFESREPPLVINAGDILQGKVVRMESYGAFVEFSLSNKGHRRPPRGLLHISQMAPHRVEQVSDIVQMGQELYCRVLEVDHDRIRLSLVGVNTETGEYDPTVASTREETSRRHTTGNGEPSRGGRGGRGGGRMPPHLERRAEHRWRIFESNKQKKTWCSPPKEEDVPGYRLLWAPSPELPDVHEEKKKVGRKRAHSSAEESRSSRTDDSSSSSSASSSTSSSSESRSRRRRRSSRKRRDRSRRSRRRRSRSYSSSSSSGSSSSKSSSSSSSSSSSDDSSSPKDKRKLPPKEILTTASESSKDKPPAPIDEEELREAREFKNAVQGNAGADSDDDDSVGPQPLPNSNAALAGSENKSSYGKALLPGEGQAIAQYVQQNLRVPRRGEIGYQPDEIDKYEKSGYVMSGSRHARMNAVRLRKENQVYSAEEQRALALITMEEKQQKEAALMEDFRKMLKEKQKLRESSSKGHDSQNK